MAELPPIDRPVHTVDRQPWRRSHVVALAVVLLGGVLLQVALWQSPGHPLDIVLFVRWIRAIAVDGLPHAYDNDLSFPPVITLIWAAIGTLDTGFRTAVDASDPTLRALTKLPATLADVGLAVSIAYWYRGRPHVAVAAAGVVLLWPITWFVSAWWGQYESLYTLPIVLAVITASAGRPFLTAVLVALALMTKPQALPFLVPFAAWYLATEGWVGSLKAGLVGIGVATLLWLPFVAAGGPGSYLASVARYQNEVLNVASLTAWNPWKLVELAVGRALLDTVAVLGPVTLRHLGFTVAAIAALPVFIGIRRDPTPERLALGLAAVSLIAFTALTTMHERYAFAAFPLLLMGIRGRPDRSAVFAAFSVVYLLQLLVVRPEGWVMPFEPQLWLVGPIVLVAITAVVVFWTWKADDDGRPEPVAARVVADKLIARQPRAPQ